MAVLVTGGAGYIGSHMALALIDRGIETIVLDDLSTGFRWLVPSACTFIQGRIDNRALLDRIMLEYQIDAICHFAARVIIPESVTDPLGYYRANSLHTETLIEAAVGNGVERFIFSSTAAVYGNASTIPVTEATEIAPISPYGRSKAVVEWMLDDTARAHPFRYLALRYFNVAGADPRGRAGQASPQATHLIKLAVQTALGLRPQMTVYGVDYPTPDGSCIRDYIHVSDLIDAHLLGLDYLAHGGSSMVLNCAYGQGSSVLEVIDMVKRISGRNFDVTIEGRRPGDPAMIIADGGRIRECLGWLPQHNALSKIISDALAWEDFLQRRS